MDTLATFLLFISFSFTNTISAVDICKPSSCSNNTPQVRFPFRLRDHQPENCGFPGFDLSCNDKNQLTVNLPITGKFVVNYIDYTTQAIYIQPDFCLPITLHSFSLSGSPYSAAFTRNYTFFNCSTKSSQVDYPAESLNCLSGANNSIIAIPSYLNVYSAPPTCRNISTVEFPVQGGSVFLQEDFLLIWGLPFCRSCEIRDKYCGFKNDAMLEIGCSDPPRHGLATGAKYGIILGAGIPGLILLVYVLNYTSRRIRAYTHLRRHRNAHLPTTTIVPQPTLFIMGLDRATIESYPKIVLGESKRLPNPSDSTCSICLSEYQPKETLRSIPECNHYFHADCIDEWLRLNATCPVCRKSPKGSTITATPTSSMSSTTSLVST